jgi:hypothetical protein
MKQRLLKKFRIIPLNISLVILAIAYGTLEGILKKSKEGGEFGATLEDLYDLPDRNIELAMGVLKKSIDILEWQKRIP